MKGLLWVTLVRVTLVRVTLVRVTLVRVTLVRVTHRASHQEIGLRAPRIRRHRGSS